MKETQPVLPPDEPCVVPPPVAPSPNEVLVSINDALHPSEIANPPSEVRIPLSQALTMLRTGVDVNPLIGLYDQQTPFRLIAPLREAAQTKNPSDILARAAAAFHTAQNGARGASTKEALRLGTALADLAVTGRAAYTRFQREALDETALNAATLALLPRTATAAGVANAVKSALDRAFAVAWALRGPAAQRPALRKDLGWIAVSSDDDKPHRPVNVPAPPFEQFEVSVSTVVPGRPEDRLIANLPIRLTVRTRFIVASAVDDPAPPAVLPAARTLPPDPVPHIPAGHQVILFIHGHSSSAEEALPLIPDLLQAGLDRGRKYSVISLDLPNNGYSESFDHENVAGRDDTSWPSAPLDSRPICVPVLDYLENFIVAFVDTLDAISPIKRRIAGVVGGSLGGNLGLRLSQRDTSDSPWLRAGVVSWSAACVWKPMVNSFTNSVAPGVCWGRMTLPELPDTRAEYFTSVYDKPAIVVAGSRTQPQMWFRDGWEPCKTHHISDSRMARQEIYDANFRQWHWRVACEQLVFSHIDHVDHVHSNPRRYELNRTVPQLLIAGEMDDFVGTYIFRRTREMSAFMKNVPGRSLFLKETGHSMHIERPRFVAREIVDFLFTPPAGLVLCDDQQDVITTWKPLALGAQGFGLLENTPSRLYDLHVLNRFDHWVQVIAVRITTSADVPGAPVFSLTFPPPFWVQKDKDYGMVVQYNGTAAGLLTGFVEVECDDTSDPIVRIPLSATVMANKHAELDITPNALDYGDTLVGTAVTKTLTITNTGFYDATIAIAVMAEQPVGAFTVGASYPASALPTFLAPTESAAVVVRFEPKQKGAASATLSIDLRSRTIKATAVHKHRYEMPLVGTARMPAIVLARGRQKWLRVPGQPDAPVAERELKVLDFGLAAPGKTSSASFWVRNVGDAPLTVHGVVENTRGSFSLADDSIFPAVLPPVGEMEVSCLFLASPVAGKTTSGTFRVLCDDPLRTDGGTPPLAGAILELKGRAGGRSLTDPVEFERGIVVVSRPPASTTFRFRSDGTTPVTVRKLQLTELNPGTNFVVTSSPQVPVTLASGSELTLTVVLAAVTPGSYEADLRLEHDGNAQLSSQVRLSGRV